MTAHSMPIHTIWMLYATKDWHTNDYESFIAIEEFKSIETCLFYKIWKLQKRKSMTQRKFTGHIIGTSF